VTRCSTNQSRAAPRGDLEAGAGVGVEVAARHEHELLQVRRRLEGLARELTGDELVVRRDDHEKRRRGDALEVIARVVALEQLERAQRHLARARADA
jgi:hypothetical protein